MSGLGAARGQRLRKGSSACFPTRLSSDSDPRTRQPGRNRKDTNQIALSRMVPEDCYLRSCGIADPFRFLARWLTGRLGSATQILCAQELHNGTGIHGRHDGYCDLIESGRGAFLRSDFRAFERAGMVPAGNEPTCHRCHRETRHSFPTVAPDLTQDYPRRDSGLFLKRVPAPLRSPILFPLWTRECSTIRSFCAQLGRGG